MLAMGRWRHSSPPTLTLHNPASSFGFDHEASFGTHSTLAHHISAKFDSLQLNFTIKPFSVYEFEVDDDHLGASVTKHQIGADICICGQHMHGCFVLPITILIMRLLSQTHSAPMHQMSATFRQ